MSDAPTPDPQPDPEPEQPDTGDTDELGRAVEDGRDYLGREVADEPES